VRLQLLYLWRLMSSLLELQLQVRLEPYDGLMLSSFILQRPLPRSPQQALVFLLTLRYLLLPLVQLVALSFTLPRMPRNYPSHLEDPISLFVISRGLPLLLLP